MKKLFSLLLALSLLFSLTACGGNSSQESSSGSSGSSAGAAASGSGSQDSSATEPEQEEEPVYVNVTLPASFFSNMTSEEIQAAAQEQGYTKCVINQDGSVTYTMTQGKYDEVMEGMKASLDKSIADLVDGDNAVESFVKIEYTDDMSEINVYVDPETYSSLDASYALSFYILGAYYQVFSGTAPDDVDVVVNFINNNTNEIIESASYQDMRSSEEADAASSSAAQ